MRNNIPGITMVPLGDEIAAHIQAFINENRYKISTNQLFVLERWVFDKDVMQELGFQYFAEWEANDRKLILAKWVSDAIQDVLSVYD